MTASLIERLHRAAVAAAEALDNGLNTLLQTLALMLDVPL